MKENKRKVTHKGVLNLNDISIDCYVLEDGTRVLSGREMQRALMMVDTEKGNRTAGTRLYRHLNQKSLEPFIYKEKKEDHFNPLTCFDGSKKINGYEATTLVDICDAFLQARKEIKLSSRQIIIAEQCEILVRSFAKVGLIALIDEATGFQIDRKHDALRVLIQAYVSEEARAYLKEFPDAFFDQLDRLYGNPKTKPNGRPFYYGKFIGIYVYKPMESGVILKELDKVNPKNIKGHRKKRFHQFLTTDIGIRQLRIQIGKVLSMMEFSTNLRQFKNNIQRLNAPPNLFSGLDEDN